MLLDPLEYFDCGSLAGPHCVSYITGFQTPSGESLSVLILAHSVIEFQPIPVAERSKAWVCSRSPTGIAGSNPAGGMDVCLL